MTKIVSYRDLEAWQLGMSFVEEVYALTRSFPREELAECETQMELALRLAFAPPNRLRPVSAL